MQIVQPRLAQATLGLLPKNVQVPSYDRQKVTLGIVHLGLGAFHRAHQAVFVDDCLARGESEWGLIGASLLSRRTRDAIGPQNGLYTTVVRDNDQEFARVVGSISKVIVAPEKPAELLAHLSAPQTRIVSLTITEKGYTINLANGELLEEHPDLRHDLANPCVPRSALGFLLEASVRRHASGIPPFTVLSCDNLPNNGPTVKSALTQFARLRDANIAKFVEEQIACPATMVDRIVPSTTDSDRHTVAATLGMWDEAPVITEPFFQWVVEDTFSMGRPTWERSGVSFVSSVRPYEHMKLRLLNGAHTASAAIGRTAGMATVAEVVSNPLMRHYLNRYWEEVAPTIDPALDIRTYQRDLIKRFGNASLNHKTMQIATDASQKIPQRILAPLRELRIAGRPTAMLIFAVAAWIRSCAGFNECGCAMPLNDPVFQALPIKPDLISATEQQIIETFLRIDSIFGDLRQFPKIAGELEAALILIRRDGVLSALRIWMQQHVTRV